ncbi:MAG TPA: S8 family serine peptidase [Candidatus Poseidoniaceae archaeon]|nr:S8 family serine peptidase [Candidatus Poseidoniaceae archaeon]
MRVAALLVFSLLMCVASPVLATASIMDVGEDSPLKVLDGSGVVIAVADTGIDMDHSCFRNSTFEVGGPGLEHRKIVHLNDTVDDWDTQGHQQFRHGTHIAGILACDQLDGDSSMRSLSHGAKLVVQDIVNSSGWVVPEDVTSLLAESSRYGAVINSWSWGDNTVNYTERSSMVDKWTIENPWSLVFVAPGNTGNTMLEPSNAYNVVSVVASDSNQNGSLWSGNSHGPDVNERRGTFIAAPGMSIVSAKADGTKLGMNNESYAMTGTSMAAPMAASFTALLQELIQTEYGYTPSAPLLRAMLASSGEVLTGGDPDSMQGYGRPSLESFENGFIVHDSYEVNDWVGLIQSRGGVLEQMIANPWNGSGAAGPFLSENESWSKLYQPIPGEDVEVVMSYNARPGGYEIDDLRLIVTTSDGRFAIDDQMSNSGYSQLYYGSFTEPLQMNSSNETTVMIRLPASQLEGVEWVSIEVVAKDLYEGLNVGYLGIEGTKIGFGVVATGLQNLTQNTAPKITVIDSPLGGENYSENFSLLLNISDKENDGYVVAIRLNNSNYSVELSDCAVMLEYSSNVSCEVDIVRDLIPRPVNREDWKFEVIVVDDNSSIWTGSEMSVYLSNNFSIFWTSPLIDNPEDSPSVDQDEGVEQNRALLWGIIGVVLGVIVAAGVMFRGFERRVLDGVPPPFREEE